MRANAVREEAVSLTNELGPALHAIHAIGVDRLPSWTHWLLADFHVRLSRSPVSLSRIAKSQLEKIDWIR
jgi:hypothetical protein